MNSDLLTHVKACPWTNEQLRLKIKELVEFRWPVVYFDGMTEIPHWYIYPVGKYKDKTVQEANDSSYMCWYINNVLRSK